MAADQRTRELVQRLLFDGEPSPRPYYLTDEEKEEIRRAYLAGETGHQIADRIGRSWTAVYGALRSGEVPIRGKHECDLRHTLNRQAFDNLEKTLDPAGCYFVGLLLTDGYIITGKEHQPIGVGLGLKASDIALIEQFRTFLDSNHPISVTKYSRPGRDNHERWEPFARIAIGSCRLAQTLGRYGVVPHKTPTARVELGLDDSPDFWRGCIDGDGSLFWSAHRSRGKERRPPRLTMTGSRSLLEQFLSFVARSRPCWAGGKIVEQTGCWALMLGCTSAVDVVRILYDRPGPALARKATLAKEFLGWKAVKRPRPDLTYEVLEAYRIAPGGFTTAAEQLDMSKNALRILHSRRRQAI